jgi:hypothetical protein
MDLIAILIDVYFSQDKKKHVSHEFLLEFDTVANRRDIYYAGVGNIWVAFNKKNEFRFFPFDTPPAPATSYITLTL